MKQVLSIIICISVGILIGFYSQNKVSLKFQNECDSLKSEIFIKDLNIMRYENIIDNISQDSICSKILNKTINETE
jgi:hypothetical protein